MLTRQDIGAKINTGAAAALNNLSIYSRGKLEGVVRKLVLGQLAGLARASLLQPFPSREAPCDRDHNDA